MKLLNRGWLLVALGLASLVAGEFVPYGRFVAVFAGLLLSRWCAPTTYQYQLGVFFCLVSLVVLPLVSYYRFLVLPSNDSQTQNMFFLSVGCVIVGAVGTFFLRRKLALTLRNSIITALVATLFMAQGIAAGGHGAALLPLVVCVPLYIFSGVEAVSLFLAAPVFTGFLLAFLPRRGVAQQGAPGDVPKVAEEKAQLLGRP